MKTKIFVDFDKTLFESSQAKAKLAQIFSQLGFSQSEIEQTYLVESLGGKFNPKGQIERLKKIRSFNTSVAEMKIKSMIFDANKMLYNDSIDFLDDIERNKYEVNLLSYGDNDFQSKKIKHSGIVDKFDNIYIANIEKHIFLKDIVKLDEYFITIDDREDVLEKISKNFPKSFGILIDRKIEKIFKNENFNGSKVNNLIQAQRYL